MAKNSNPYAVKLDAAAEKDLAHWLSDELDRAEQAVSDELDNIDEWWNLYEMGPTRRAPLWEGAADLTSYIGAEKTDAMHARIMKTVFVEPMWTVEAWGDAAKRAAIVEEFHEWKVQEEKLRGVLDKVYLNSLVETMGILEVTERAEIKKVREQRRVRVLTHEDGSMLLGDDNRPILYRDEQKDLEDVPMDSEMPAAEGIFERLVKVSGGPEYTVVQCRDFRILPAHAAARRQIFAFAKRFWKRVPELKDLQDRGIYRNVEQLGDQGERSQETADTRANTTVAPQEGPTAEKELWEVLLLHDCDGDGIEEWCVVTLSAQQRVILRVDYDPINLPRFLIYVPFPRPNTVRGYSFIGHKLYTLIEEHTAERNLIMDREVLQNSAPIKRVLGSAWDPEEQPFSPGGIIDVKDLREVEPMVIPATTAGMVERERTTLAASERVSGMSDVASLGTLSQQDRTLGEVNQSVSASYVRMDAVIHRLQETNVDLWLIRHELWKRALKRDAKGMDAPSGIVQNLALKSQELTDGKFTPALLDGVFRGKPHGSVDNADIMGLRSDFNGFMGAIANLAKVSPALQQMLSDPETVRAVMEQAMRVYRWNDRQAFLKNPSAQQQPMAGQPAAGALPPGAPPDLMQQVMKLLPPAGGAGVPPPTANVAGPMAVQ
jgi:hypothetical protein